MSSFSQGEQQTAAEVSLHWSSCLTVQFEFGTGTFITMLSPIVSQSAKRAARSNCYKGRANRGGHCRQ